MTAITLFYAPSRFLGFEQTSHSLWPASSRRHFISTSTCACPQPSACAKSINCPRSTRNPLPNRDGIRSFVPTANPDNALDTLLPTSSADEQLHYRFSVALERAKMAPTGPKSLQPQRRPSPSPLPLPPLVDEGPKGPSPGNIAVSNQYRFEQNIRRLQKEYGCDPAREDSYRIQGVQLIDSVRQSLRLCVSRSFLVPDVLRPVF